MIIEQPIYNGDLIHKRFAYQYFKKQVSPVGNIVSFRAPMFVSDNLIDLEDSLTKDYISKNEQGIIFMGRLAQYKYLDMWMAVKHVMLKLKNYV